MTFLEESMRLASFKTNDSRLHDVASQFAQCVTAVKDGKMTQDELDEIVKDFKLEEMTISAADSTQQRQELVSIIHTILPLLKMAL